LPPRVKPMKPRPQPVTAHPKSYLFLAAGAIVTIAIAVLVGTSITASQAPAATASYNPVPTPTATALGIHEPVQPPTLPKGKTLASFAYNSNPPTSGPGASRLVASYVSARALSKAEVAALLAKGNVVIAYGPGADTASIRSFAKNLDSGQAGVSARLKAGDGVVLMPWPSLKGGEVDLLAWTRLWQLPSWNLSDAQSFTKAFLGNAQNIAQ